MKKNLPPVLTKQLLLFCSVKTNGRFFSNFWCIFRKSGLYLLEVCTYLNILVQNVYRVFSRLVSCLKSIELVCQVLHGHFEPVYLLQFKVKMMIKHDLLKWFGCRHLLKVTWIQNEFMRSSFVPKSQPKITEISALKVY